jgi:Mrp family chromosome partitioning ATPase
MKQKTIIVSSGKANVGKSMTLSRLGEQLSIAGATTMQSFPKKDYHAYFNYKSKEIGIQTYGDTEKLVKDGLKAFNSKSCGIIVIASKGFGATVKAIESFAKANDYRVLWTTPYRVWDGSISESDTKDYSASHLKMMVDDVITGIL